MPPNYAAVTDLRADIRSQLNNQDETDLLQVISAYIFCSGKRWDSIERPLDVKHNWRRAGDRPDRLLLLRSDETKRTSPSLSHARFQC